MIERTDTSIRVQAEVDVDAGRLFAVLADPRRHIEIDGSGMLRGTDPTSPVPLTAVGEVFTMDMTYPGIGQYRTENHVVEIEHDRRITWTTGREGSPPAGVWWTWILEPTDDRRTVVTHVYDWSRVIDPAVLARVSFPRVSAEDMRTTVGRLVEAAA